VGCIIIIPGMNIIIKDPRGLLVLDNERKHSEARPWRIPRWLTYALVFAMLCTRR